MSVVLRQKWLKIHKNFRKSSLPSREQEKNFWKIWAACRSEMSLNLAKIRFWNTHSLDALFSINFPAIFLFLLTCTVHDLNKHHKNYWMSHSFFSGLRRRISENSWNTSNFQVSEFFKSEKTRHARTLCVWVSLVINKIWMNFHRNSRSGFRDLNFYFVGV